MEWCEEVKKLSEFAITQPHASLAAFIHGEQHKFRYFMRTIPGMEEYLKPLDEVISERFLPAILDSQISETERALYALPIREGGLGISNFASLAQSEFTASTTVTAPLAAIIIMQETELPDAEAVQEAIRSKRLRCLAEQKLGVESIDATLSLATLCAVTQAREKGASSLLSVQPSNEHGFSLNKSEFCDAIALHYHQNVKNLP